MIENCIVHIAAFSKHRTNGKLLKKTAAVRALINGADLHALCINGMPCSTYCSIRDMNVNTRVELREGNDCLAYLILEAKHFAAVAEVKPKASASSDIPQFMAGHPVELD